MGLRIVVSGYLGLLPAGGVTWDYIQYPLGFQDLGHDVFYIEDTRLWPVFQIDAHGGGLSHVTRLATTMKDFGLDGRWAYRDEPTSQWFGQNAGRVRDILRSADVLVNVSCANPLNEDVASVPIRVLIDSDPMFTQVQAAAGEAFTPGGGGMQALLAGHSHHFTFGENVGSPDCKVPEVGIRWRPTRQPICLGHWPVTPVPPDAAYSTVMNWSAGRPLEWLGESWGQKDVEFMRFIDLPRASPRARFCVAVGQTTGAPFPQVLAATRRWEVVPAAASVGTWSSYRTFIERSRGECSVAKETYVKARTGWFSCRSACYLAAGRPVVTQDTGWSRHYPTGEGLFSFTTLEEAADAIGAIDADAERHGQAARRIAEEHFASRVVLGALLREAGA